MRWLSRCSLPVLVATLAVGVGAACDKKPDDGFGEPKRVTDNGTLGNKPVEPPPPPPPDFTGALTLDHAFDKATGKLVVTMKLKPGFHAYGPGETVGKPVAMAIDKQGGWAAEGPIDIPAGKQKDLGELGTSMILEGDVPLTATVKGGQGAILGVVKAQVCTDTACDRPKLHEFSVPTI